MPRRRALPVLILLLLVGCGRAFSQDRSYVCPVTSVPNPPFVPPPPHWTDAGSGMFWYGTDSLWTILDADGRYKKVYNAKLSYWQREFDWRKHLRPELKVVAKRLDHEARPIVGNPASVAFVLGPSIMSGIEIREPGCWEITAHYFSNTLSFVVSVEP